jgi:solute carrier family 36 (proton-coupled amino acid transporter)
MSSPSKPLSIGSPLPRRQNNDENEENATNTPDLRQLRQQFGTPPVGTTIPPFRAPGTYTPLAVGSPARPSSSVENRLLGLRGTPQLNSLDPGAGANTPPVLPDTSLLDEEDKIKVLRRHLVPREQRLGHSRGASSQLSSSRPSIHEQPTKPSSKQPSRPPSPGASRENLETFPLPYNAPGGDITYV